MIIKNQKMDETFKKRHTLQTRRVEVIPVKESNKNSEIDKDFYDILRDYRYHCWLLSNKVMSQYYLLNNEFLRRKNNGEKVSENEIVQEWTNEECNTKSNFGYYLSGEFYDEIPGAIRRDITTGVRKKFDNERKDVNAGRRSLTTYRLKGIEMPFSSNGSTLEKLDNNFYFKPNFKKSSYLFLKFGKDMSNNRIIFENVYDGNYRLADSYLKFDKNKLFFYVCYYSPKVKKELDEKIVLGIDLGIRVPAVCANNIDYKYTKFIGNGDYIEKKRKEFFKKKKTLDKSLNCVSITGEGYKKKMNAKLRLSNRESKFFKNINHNMSKQIIDEAIKQKAGIINFEDLSSIKDIEKKSKSLRDWTYHSLMTMVEQKAKKHGIKVKKIDPYHTSQTCSICGHYEKNQRHGGLFICKNEKCGNYGKKQHADLNAAKNIAKSEKFK